jgi:Caspase domain
MLKSPITFARAGLVVGCSLLLSLHALEARAEDRGRVFALLAIDTDSHITGIEDDGRSMTSALRGGFGNIGILDMKVISKQDVRPDVIVNYFRRVPSGPNDVLLFYYTGHGATFEGEGHTLTTSYGNLLRQTLVNQMRGRRPRLCVLLTDCCSSLVKPRKIAPAPGAGVPPEEVSPILRCLFLEHQGLVDITSSSFGEISWSGQGTGGLFTHALTLALGGEMESCDSNKDGFLTWTELFDHVRLDTQAGYRNFKQSVLKLDAQAVNGRLRATLQNQLDQIPQAFSLGEPLKLNEQREYFAPNIGIFFRLVTVGDAAGARLTRDPVAGSGAAQLRLEPGDTIYLLDSLPIRMAVDVMNHHARTDVVFINVRTGKPQAGVMVLPPYTPLPADVPKEVFAPNLGIHYQPIPLSGGTLGARLSRTANGNAPAAAIGLELGDMIIRLDGQPIKKPEDVLAHIDQTSVEFVNIRTGKRETRVAQLPGQAVQ